MGFKKRNRSKNEDSSTEVTASTDGEVVKAKVTEGKRLEREAKYLHLLPGSMRDVPNGQVVDGVRSKGRLCTIVCVDCGTHRTVNVQDVHQTNRCQPWWLQHGVTRRREALEALSAGGVGGSDPAAE